MRQHRPGFAAIAALALALLCEASASARSERVVLAGGCFWGVQAVFASLNGVQRTTAGFSGGAAATAHYEIVSTGMTGHAESVEVVYDPSRISFHQILDVYFLAAHDPTQLNRQGPDDGSQYRSAIFYTTRQQRDEAHAEIAALSARHVYSAPIVTKVEPLAGFYAAEDYHQDYLVHNPDSGYIVYNDIPKLKTLMARFPNLVNRRSAPIQTIAALK